MGASRKHLSTWLICNFTFFVYLSNSSNICLSSWDFEWLNLHLIFPIPQLVFYGINTVICQNDRQTTGWIFEIWETYMKWQQIIFDVDKHFADEKYGWTETARKTLSNAYLQLIIAENIGKLLWRATNQQHKMGFFILYVHKCSFMHSSSTSVRS